MILYELLTEERPFRGDMRMILFQILHEDPVSPRRLNSRIPRDLETICAKALEKNPEQRYASAREFQAALRKLVASFSGHLRASAPSPAPPPGAVEAMRGSGMPAVAVSGLDGATGADSEVVELASGVYWVGRRTGAALGPGSASKVHEGRFASGNAPGYCRTRAGVFGAHFAPSHCEMRPTPPPS